jgi:hypothetical protein
VLQLLSKDRPSLVLCDFMAEACADVCDTLGVPYAITMSSIPPDCKWGQKAAAEATMLKHNCLICIDWATRSVQRVCAFIFLRAFAYKFQRNWSCSYFCSRFSTKPT